MTNLTQHPCSDKCSDFKGEQCGHCLIQQQEYVVGDTVVFIDISKSDRLMTVTQVQKNGVLLDGNSNFALNHLIRHATTQELSLNRRVISDFDKHLGNAIKAQEEVA
ncbi:hypothetical protein [Acinetobacter sp.]|uniref:hypothetical protein n=1 Tax=Acinetobacter sp. TaxID=472 RepID=UPI002FD8DDBA